METKQLCALMKYCQKQYALMGQFRNNIDELYSSIGGNPSDFESRLERIGRTALKEQELKFWTGKI